MGSKINLINTSGKRFNKKTRINHSNLTADGTKLFIESQSVTEPVGGGGIGGGGGFVEITYSDLVNSINGSNLTAGTFYKITNFRTCYDQPDFNSNGTAITTGNYKQAAIEPIMVFATSANTISTTAYQPAYPNDRIQYDWTFSATEITQGVAYGRISERIDAFNNRTDYDHRTILFKRYKLFTFRPNQPLNGTIQLFNNGIISGINTSFTTLTVGDVVYIPSTSPSYYEIVSITGNTAMTVSGDTITAIGAGQQIFPTILETNGSDGYFSFKRTNVKTNDFIEYTTFGDAISNEYVKNTYVGNFANNYQNVGYGFMLSNNVFLEGQYESNKFGDYCYNNTFGTDNQNSIWGDYCYENVSTNDIDYNIIGHYFNNNLMNVNLTNNHIGNDFSSNKLLAENSENFEDNIIGNDFTNNTIYSWFYSNEILNNFSNNIIGDFDDLTNFQFYGNIIGTNFTDNTITDNFYKNEIGYGFYNNEISGETFTNRIGEQFENNTIYGAFYDNQIFNEFKGNMTYQDFNANKVDWGFGSNQFSGSCGGNVFGPFTTNNDFLGLVFGNVIKGDFEGNTIGAVFGTNNIGSGFYNNTIAQNFGNNEIGNFFTDNTIGEGFGFGGSSTQKNYIGDYFYNNTVGEYFYNNRVGNYFLNNTLGDYFQWNVIDTGINLVDFTPNYGNITAFTYTTLGTGTTDGVYTNLNGITNGHGVNATFNIEVSGNTVIGVSGNTSGKLYQTGNTITILGTQIGGVTGVISGFTTNKLSVKIYKPADSTYEFPDNEIEMDYLIDNSPLFDTYYSPNIQGVSYSTKTGVNQNQYGMVIEGYIKIPSGNTYSFGLSSDDGSDAFINGVKVADWYGAHGDNGNIPDGNQYPISLTAGTYPIKVRLQERNGQDIVSLLYSSNSGSTWNIIPDNWFPIGITGITGSYPNIVAQGTGSGENATFDVEVIDGLVDSVVLSNGGGSYSVGEILTILGSAFGGTEDINITVDSVYSDGVIVTVTGIGPNPSVYEHYTCQIFERQGGSKRLSYYDSSDILTIKNINE